MTGQKNSVLTLMFSVTGSMASYQSAGSYPRFVARLQAYAAHFERVHVCTYDQRDYTGEWLLSNVRHHPMPRFLASSIPYHLLSPMLHRGALEETTTIRAFNITGALPALLVRAYSGAPIMVSYGYSLPDFVRHESGTLKYHVYRLVEEIALRRCDRILCATPSQTESLGARYGRGKARRNSLLPAVFWAFPRTERARRTPKHGHTNPAVDRSAQCRRTRQAPPVLTPAGAEQLSDRPHQ